MSENFKMSASDKPREETLEEMLERVGRLIPPVARDPYAGTNIHSTDKIRRDAIRKEALEKQKNKKTKKSEQKTSPIGTSWAGMVGDKIDESERRMDNLM